MKSFSVDQKNCFVKQDLKNCNIRLLSRRKRELKDMLANIIFGCSFHGAVIEAKLWILMFKLQLHQVLDARLVLSATAAYIRRNARMQAATTAILTFTMPSTTSR